MHVVVLAQPGSWYLADLRRAAELRRLRLTGLPFEQLSAAMGTGHETLHAGDQSLTDVDALIVRSMPPGSLEQVVFRMDLLARLAATGRQVLNPPKSLECAIDKYLTSARLQQAGLPIPATEVCESAEAALGAFERLGGDVVVKPLFGAEGRGILRVSDPDLACRTFRTLARLQAVLYVQQFVRHPGWDLRVLVLDGRVLGGMRRSHPDDFRTNVSRNARAEVMSPSDRECDWALRATAAVGARFAGVDILYDVRGQGYVLEVNGVPGWQAFQRVTQCDVAHAVLQALESPQ